MSKIKILLSAICATLVIFGYSTIAKADTYKYDNLNRLIEIIYDSGQKITYTYDAAGNILSVTNTGVAKVLASISLHKQEYILNVGQTQDVIVTANYSDGSKTTLTEGVTFTSSTPTVATIDNQGKLTGVSAGETTITATYGKAVATAKVIVNNSSDTQPPTSPKKLVKSSFTETSITMTWQASTDNVGVLGYEVYRDGKKVGITEATKYTDTELLPNKGYTYTVIAYDKAGNYSSASSGVKMSTNKDTKAPSIPENLKASDIKDTSITLTWDASTDNIGIKGYYIYRNGSKIATISETSYMDTKLAPNKEYTYMVKAFDASGNTSTNGTSIRVRTLKDTANPTIPTKLQVISVKKASVTLRWNASLDNVGVTGYEIYRDGKRIATTNKPTYKDKGVKIGSSYTYEIKAYDAAGNRSEASDKIVVTLK